MMNPFHSSAFTNSRKEAGRLAKRYSLLALAFALAFAFAQGGFAQSAAPSAAPDAFTTLQAPDSGKSVTLVGRVASMSPPESESAPHKWYVTDDKGVVLVVVFDNLFQAIQQGMEPIAAGNTVLVRGKVSVQRGILQVAPASASDVQQAPANSPMGVWRTNQFGANASSSAMSSASAAKPAAVAAAPAAVVAVAPAPAGAAASAPAAGALTVSQLNASKVGQSITVQGRVSKFRAKWNEKSPSILYLDEGGASVEVVFWDDVTAGLGARLAGVTQTGADVCATGELKDYRGRMQLQVSDAANLRLAGEAAAAPASASVPAISSAAAAPAQSSTQAGSGAGAGQPQLSHAQAGQVVTVEGNVTQIWLSANSRKPWGIVLNGPRGTANVAFTPEAAGASEQGSWLAIQPGTPVRAKGIVAESQGPLEVQVARGADIQVVAGTAPAAAAAAAPAAPPAKPAAASAPASAPAQPAAAAAAPAQVLAPSAISASNVGQTVAVRGTVRSVRPGRSDRAPTRVELADENGSVTVVFWRDSGPQFFDGPTAPVVGKPWGVVGEVSEFQSQLQVKAARLYEGQ